MLHERHARHAALLDVLGATADLLGATRVMWRAEAVQGVS
jgi:hypothetical protein